VISSLADKPMLMTFFYTRCQNSAKCSAAISRLAALQRVLERSGIHDRVRLIAITYEPQFDTPERIKRYGLDRGLRFDDGSIAIQLEQDQHQKFVDEMQPPVNYNAGWVNTHGVQLTLIDARGRVVKKYHTMLWDNEEVRRDVERVLKEI
jgi:protein SCO1/2